MAAGPLPAVHILVFVLGFKDVREHVGILRLRINLLHVAVLQLLLQTGNHILVQEVDDL